MSATWIAPLDLPTQDESKRRYEETHREERREKAKAAYAANPEKYRSKNRIAYRQKRACKSLLK